MNRFRKLRWLLLICLTVACPFFAMWVWIRTAIYFSGVERPFITGTASYIALVPAIFIVTFYFAALLAMVTWRSAQSARPKWKAFWNTIEVVWLLGSGLSIINLLATQATALVPSVIAQYEEDAKSSRAKVEDFAKILYNEFCLPSPRDQDVCTRIDRLTRIVADPVIPHDFGFHMTIDIDHYVLDHKDDPLNPDLRKMHSTMFSYDEDMGFVLREKNTKLQTEWSTPLTRATPQIFAFVLALRLGRALAVFAL